MRSFERHCFPFERGYLVLSRLIFLVLIQLLLVHILVVSILSRRLAMEKDLRGGRDRFVRAASKASRRHPLLSAV